MVLFLTLSACLSNKSNQNIPNTAMPFVETGIVQTEIVKTTATLTPTIPSQFPLNNLRMGYMVEDNLYLQDGNNLPIELSRGGVSRIVGFSDDAEKIVFYRQKTDSRDKSGMYSINVDGSGEQQLISQEWLDNLGIGTTLLKVVFIPGTHNQLFNTFLRHKEEGAGETIGLFIVNTDTGEIKEIMKPRLVGDMLPLANGNFSVSPDGKMISIAMSGSIHILNLDGEIIYPNIATYILSTPMELVPMQHWLPDSSGLILALPTEVNAGSAFSNFDYVIWRYTIGKQAVKILLDEQQPKWWTSDCAIDISVSPDGNWLLFVHEPILYLGNLRSEHTQSYGEGCSQNVFWAPDSKYFLYEDKYLKWFVGSVDGLPIPIVRFPDFISWIDANHYITLLRPLNANEKSRILVNEIKGHAILTYETGIYLRGDVYSFEGFVLLNSKTK